MTAGNPLHALAGLGQSVWLDFIRRSWLEDGTVERLIREAQEAEQAKEWALARVRYQQAAAKATGDQRQELLASLRRLTPQGK